MAFIAIRPYFRHIAAAFPNHSGVWLHWKQESAISNIDIKSNAGTDVGFGRPKSYYIAILHDSIFRPKVIM